MSFSVIIVGADFEKVWAAQIMNYGWGWNDKVFVSRRSALFYVKIKHGAGAGCIKRSKKRF